MKNLILVFSLFFCSVCFGVIPDGSIKPTKFGTVTDGSTLDQSGASSTLEIKTGGVGTAQLGSAAVTNAKVANYAVGGANRVARNTYTATITSASATAGWTYSNNGNSFTLTATISPSTTAYLQGTGPLAASGTLTCVSGCSANLTFSSFVNGAPTALSDGIAVSTSSSNFSGTALTPTAVTNLSVTLTTTGRPVMVCMVSDAANEAYISLNVSTASSWATNLLYYRASTIIGTYGYAVSAASVSNYSNFYAGPPCAIDLVAAGTYTYSVKYQSIYSSTTTGVNNFILTAFEL